MPGVGKLSRLEAGGVLKDELAESWFMVYKKAEMRGFGVIFYPVGDLECLAWGSPGDEIVLFYRTGLPIPFHEILVPFDSSITEDPMSYVKAMYNAFAHGPKVEVVKEEAARLLPKKIVSATIEKIKKEYEKRIGELNEELKKTEEDLSKAQQKASELESKLSAANEKISTLEKQLSKAHTMEGVLLVLGIIIGLGIGFIVSKRTARA